MNDGGRQVLRLIARVEVVLGPLPALIVFDRETMTIVDTMT